MPQQTTVLYQLVQQVPWEQFAELSAEPAHAADIRSFTAKSHLVALIYAQLIGAASLREIELGIGELRLILRQPGRRLIERRLERAGIDQIGRASCRERV